MIEQAARTTTAQLENPCAAETSKSVAYLRRCSAIEDEARAKMLEMTVQHGSRFNEMAVAVAGSGDQAALNFGLEAKLAEAHSRNEQLQIALAGSSSELRSANWEISNHEFAMESLRARAQLQEDDDRDTLFEQLRTQ